MLSPGCCPRITFLKIPIWGAWVAQSVKCLTLDFGSGHGLMIHGFQPHTGLHTNSAEPAWDSLSLFLSLFTLPPTCVHAFSLKINK